MGLFIDKLLNSVYALTFSDVILLPRRSEVEPYEVDLTSKFTVNIRVSLPIVSSPMDTVTEWEMAIVMASMGGIGVIHRNCTVEEQVEMVKKVKKAKPIVVEGVRVRSTDRCSVALESMERYGLEVLPVVDDAGYFLGYITYNEAKKYGNNGELIGKHVIVKNGVSIREYLKALTLVERGLEEVVAIVDGENRLLGIVTSKSLNANVTLDEEGRLRVAASISPFDIDRAKALEKHVDVLVSDIAHFHNMNAIKAAKRLIKEVNVDFIAGNIGTYEAVEDIVTTLEEFEGLRVGIASGSICTTGIVTGVAAPTLYATASVRDALEDYGLSHIPIIADGGIRTPGDAAKALAAGASTVMLGRALAGTDEAPSPIVERKGRLYKVYRGMASPKAIAKRYAIDRYSVTVKKIPEGVEGLVPYQGSVVKVIEKFKAGLQAALGYVGAKNIKELWEKAIFAKVTQHGLREISPHDIVFPSE